MCEITLCNQVLPIVKGAKHVNNSGILYENDNLDNSHTMLFVTKGHFTICENGKEYKLVKGSVIFLHKNYRHSIMHYKGVACAMYCINFDMNNNDYSYSDLAKVYILPKVLDSMSGSILEEKITSYCNFFDSNVKYYDLDINIRFYDILSECIKLNRVYRPSSAKLSEEIINYLNEHINQSLNTKDMEKRFYLTYKYMGTAFKKETGNTILQYHTGIRMDSAQRLLSNTQNSIDEISGQLGYTDALYFSRVFKKKYGLSPQSYRNSRSKK